MLAGCGASEQLAVQEDRIASTTTPPTTVAPKPSTTIPEELPWSLGDETWVATAVGDGVPTLPEPLSTATADWFFPSPTQFDGPRVFLVVGATEDYIEVSLPIRPNGSTGWVSRDDVELSVVTHRAEVDLSDDSLTVWDGDEIIVQTKAATGKPETPTPVGEFFIRDVIESNPNGAYGSFILGLSGFSETLDSFAGKEPAIAIHGTNSPDLIGQEVSNGCVRIPNELVEILAGTVPLGTPVTVVA